MNSRASIGAMSGTGSRVRSRVRSRAIQEERALAIALVWGHLRVDQFDEALQLARGCLRVWPDDEHLALMAAYAAVELAEPLEPALRQLLGNAPCKEWAALVLRRADATWHGKEH